MIQAEDNTNNVGVDVQGQQVDIVIPDRFTITGLNYNLFFNLIFLCVCE